MAGVLDPMTADDGRAVYTALVKPQRDGSLLVCILLEDSDNDNERVWLSETFDDQRAQLLTAAIALGVQE